MKLQAKTDAKDKKGEGAEMPEPIHMPWDAAMAGLASGAYDTAGYPVGERLDTDQPLAQSPAPGVDPVGGEEAAAEGDVLTNMTQVVDRSNKPKA